MSVEHPSSYVKLRGSHTDPPFIEILPYLFRSGIQCRHTILPGGHASVHEAIQ